jgi:hypothetical protein
MGSWQWPEPTEVDGWADGDYARVIALGWCPIMTSPAVICYHEVNEICRHIRQCVLSKAEQLPRFVSGVRPVFPACLESATKCLPVLLALVVKSRSYSILRLGHAPMEMRRNSASGFMPVTPRDVHCCGDGGDPDKGKKVSDLLLAEQGIFVQPIMHPTVPRGAEGGASRRRLITTTH